MAYEFHVKTAVLDEPGILVELGKYPDGSPAWHIYSPHGEPLMRPTVCTSEYGWTPEDGEVMIKDYSENSGILRCLIDAEIVVPVKAHVTPYATFYRCRILKDLNEEHN